MVVAEGRREWTLYSCREHGVQLRNQICEQCGDKLPAVRVAEVGVSPEEEPKFSKSELAQGSPVYREGWHDGYEAAGGLTDPQYRALWWAIDNAVADQDEQGLSDNVEVLRAARTRLQTLRAGAVGEGHNPEQVGLSVEEIEALLEASDVIVPFAIVAELESARAKLRAYLGQQNDA